MKKPKTVSKTSTKRFKTHVSHGWLIVLVLLAVVVLGGYLYSLSTHHTPSRSTASTSTDTTRPNTSSTPGKQYAPTASGSATSITANLPTTSTTSATLTAPSGQLLNIQTASLSGGTGLESVCQTIANASCNIRLTQGSVTKYVGAQSTGSSGAVIFDWTAKSVGLTTGVWNVQAVVTQNGASGVSHTEYLTVQP